jgi:hypothetical protein
MSMLAGPCARDGVPGEAKMTHVLLLGWLFLCPALQAAAPPPNIQLPDRPGVFAVTDHGVVEMTVFGEPRQGNYSIPSIVYGSTELDQIPVVSSIRSIFVNMMGWRPRTLYLLVGRQRLASPSSDYQRLNATINPRGVVRFEVLSHEFQPEELQKSYRRLTSKSQPGDDTRAFIVLGLSNQTGQPGRSYPVQVEVKPVSAGR